jgi:hypothetical protein
MSPFTGATRLITIAACIGVAVLGSTANGGAAPSNALMGMLPQGYSSANCQEVTPPPDGFLEKVSCGQNSDSAGPTSAVFWLLPTKDGLTEAFQGAGNGMTMASSCPGGQASPGPWHYANSPDQAAGQVECGTTISDGTTVSMVVWTDNSKMTTSLIGGTDMASLCQWWRTKSG